MLFKQKGKVPDVGKDNFQEFMKGEKDSVLSINISLNRAVNFVPDSSNDNKSIQNNTYSVQQNKAVPLSQNLPKGSLGGTHLSQTGQFPVPSPIQLIRDGSCSAAGSTWDANHLDQFLKTSKFAQTGDQIFQQSFPRVQSVNNQTINSNTKMGFFQRTKQPRLAPDKSGSHYLYQSSINHLVTNTGVNQTQQVQQDFVEAKMLEMPKKKFNQSKLQYTPNPEILTDDNFSPLLIRPSQKRQELLEAKTNQEIYQQWRSECFEKTKAYRVAKNGFRSGIISIDNPEQENTILYKQEQDTWKKSLIRQLEFKKQREKILEKFNSANPSLEFDNAKFIRKSGVDNKVDDLLNKGQQQFPQRNYELEKDWIKKKEVKISINCQVNLQFVQDRLNTNDRLFGNNSNQIKDHTLTKRALNLRQHELRGKNYDLITLTRNDLPQ